MTADSAGFEFFDSNVIVYALACADDAESLRKRNVARRLLLDAAERNCAVISAQVLSEAFVTLTRKSATPMAPAEAAAHLRGIATTRVVPLTADVFFKAVEMQIRFQLSYWDSLIISAAESARCGTVWSEDLNDGQMYAEVRVRNPFK